MHNDKAVLFFSGRHKNLSTCNNYSYTLIVEINSVYRYIKKYSYKTIYVTVYGMILVSQYTKEEKVSSWWFLSEKVLKKRSSQLACVEGSIWI